MWRPSHALAEAQAEPITVSSISLFLRLLEPYGLSPASMSPGYGLAEHTVYVSDSGSLVLLVDKEQLELHRVLVNVCEPIPLAQLLTTGACLCASCT